MTDPTAPFDAGTPEVAPRLVQREWRFQEAVAAFLGKALPPEAYWTSIDQGRASNDRIGGARKRRGIRAGLPDVMISHCGTTLWLELKVSASLTEAQRQTHISLIANGHNVAVPRTLEQVEDACRRYGIPLRATLGAIRDRIADQQARIVPKPKRAARNRAEPRVTAPKGWRGRVGKKGIMV